MLVLETIRLQLVGHNPPCAQVLPHLRWGDEKEKAGERCAKRRWHIWKKVGRGFQVTSRMNKTWKCKAFAHLVQYCQLQEAELPSSVLGRDIVPYLALLHVLFHWTMVHPESKQAGDHWYRFQVQSSVKRLLANKAGTDLHLRLGSYCNLGKTTWPVVWVEFFVHWQRSGIPFSLVSHSSNRGWRLPQSDGLNMF